MLGAKWLVLIILSSVQFIRDAWIKSGFYVIFLIVSMALIFSNKAFG